MTVEDDAPAAFHCKLPCLDGLARRLVGKDAEDAVRDCLLKAFRGLHQLVKARLAESREALEDGGTSATSAPPSLR